MADTNDDLFQFFFVPNPSQSANRVPLPHWVPTPESLEQLNQLLQDGEQYLNSSDIPKRESTDWLFDLVEDYENN